MTNKKTPTRYNLRRGLGYRARLSLEGRAIRLTLWPSLNVKLDYMGSLRALGAVLNRELHPIALEQVAIPFTLDGRVVDENVLLILAIGLDEAPTFPAVEPLDSASDSLHLVRYLLNVTLSSKPDTCADGPEYSVAVSFGSNATSTESKNARADKKLWRQIN